MGFTDKLVDRFRKQLVQYVFGFGYNSPIWSTQRDEEFIRQAYNRIVWVYACVAMISSCVASVPWVLYRTGRGGKLVEIDAHPLLTMFNKKINKYFSSHDFFDLWATYLALQGKFFALYNNAVLPTQMEFLYPHFVNPQPDREVFVRSFEYNIAGEKYNYLADEVLWSKFNDPLDAYQGLSPVKAMARTIDTENARIDWNKSTFDNAGVPPGAFILQNPNPETIKRVREDWLERYGGSKNARIPLVLNADKGDYKSFGFSAVDMDYLNQAKIGRVEICTGFGVPGQVVGDPEGQTYANYGEALKAFWENTVIPRYLDHMKDKLNNDLVVRYADNLLIDYDLDNVKALHESQDSISLRTEKLFKGGLITRNEGRLVLGYDEDAEGDKYIQDLAMGLLDTLKPPKEEEEEVGSKGREDKALDMSIEQKVVYWAAFETKRTKFYSKIEGVVKGQFEVEQKKVVKAVKAATEAGVKSALKKALKDAEPAWKKALMATFIAVVEAFGRDVFADLQEKKSIKQDSFDVYTEEVMSWIASTAAEEVRYIQDTTLQSLKGLISKGFIEGESILEIAKRIDTLYLEQIIPKRSIVIAQTEVISASNFGSIQAAKQVNPELKKFWIPTYDQKTRDTHLDMGNHPAVGLEEDFAVGSSSGGYPGDPSLSAKERIRCRCAVGYNRE